VSVVKRVYECTLQLTQLFEAHQERDEKILQIEELLAQRETLLKDMSGPYSDEEKELGKQILILNEKLDEYLKKEKVEIQIDINNLNKKKESNNKYANPYENVSTDGMFYDKRK
jgi:flagellar protein FliT